MTSFPSSVEHLPLARSKRHGRRIDRERDAEALQADGAVDGKDVDTKVEVGVGGTILDFGRSGGAGLERGKKGWTWVWASEARQDLRYVAGEKSTILFPGTHSVDGVENVKLPSKEMIDSSTKYIESLCSPYEKYGLREALLSIIDDNQPEAGPSNTSKSPAGAINTPEKDVYDGPKIAIIDNSRARIAKSLLAFPVGEIGHHLNISPFLPANSTKVDSRSKSHFVPTHKVVERFPTPILQIVSSPVVSSARIDREATALLIRLQSTTHLVNLIPDHAYVPPSSSPPVISQRTAQLSYEDTEGRRHVDAALDANVWSRVLVVDESGGVWLWWEEKETKGSQIEKVWNLRKVRDKVTEERHQYFQIAFGTRPGTAIVLSSKEAVIIDIDDPEHPSTNLLTLRSRDRHFLSLDKTASERDSLHVVIATTHEVMWVDEDRPGTPVLSWKHDCGSKDLHVAVIPGLSSKDWCTILYSPTLSFILSFSTTKTSPIRSLSNPYAINLPLKQINSVIPFFPASSRHPRNLIGLSPDGGVHLIPIFPYANALNTKREGGRKITGLKAIWDEDVGRFTKNHEDRKGDRAEKIGKEMDFRWAWLEINRPVRSTGEEVYFSPKEFERYLRELDAPLEHLMTAADLARDSIYPESNEQRSHLLTPLPVHHQASRSTLESLSEINITKYLPVVSSINSIQPIFKECRPPMSNNDPLELFEEYKQTYPTSSSNNHISQLILDLSLSRIVLFSEPVSPLAQNALEEMQQSEPEDELFARVTEQLSLTDTDRLPPKIKFHFLTPNNNQLPQDYEEGTRAEYVHNDMTELQDPTARGILNDWKIGDDPSSHTWSSWRTEDQNHDDNSIVDNSNKYNDDIPSSIPSYSQIQRRIKRLPPSKSSVSFSQPYLNSTETFHSLQSKPSSMTNTSLPTMPQLGQMARSSPPPIMQNSSQQDESQWAATQVERGPFGGREGREKKKKKEKKRVGGF
ncbi:uncharacterized protein IL334_000299 [Kwoniella shivajii]|uniref:RNA polymerase I-specific transcription initiation factor RRN6-like protein n=1 Tax=Kwoniella shivajii TaxID=564305 RepID=A0ABZ1CQ90_9TREE|nr:hypothetical protein IL334_000299 [Kwoniella shivajii]